jgi:hypothetical protein
MQIVECVANAHNNYGFLHKTITVMRLSAPLRKQPRTRLLGAFLILSAAAFLGVVSGVAYLYQSAAEAEIIGNAEKSNVVLA